VQGFVVARPVTSHLLQVSKSDKKTINLYRFGAQIFRASGLEIDDLANIACRDRFRLAARILSSGQRAMMAPRPEYRLVLGRAYYAMYHAMRAVVYFAERGDDYEEHSNLPKHVPQDFPEKSKWENELKKARLERNRADYDPYPITDRAFSSTARATLDAAQALLPIARHYLVRKGCQL
jgi:uncharacterized protein (UPF0332 family)